MASVGNHSVFSVVRLLLLAEDFESDAVAINYAETFLDLLPGRIEHILSTVLAGDTAAAMDSALSLKVRSHMVGAEALEQSCRILQKCLSDGDPATAVIAAERVARDGDALQTVLEEFLRK
jgi:HPt (histidine-containing phosphotransfer) domain-containing protein